jgi:hypothetical protein
LINQTQKEILTHLRIIPGIGVACALDLFQLGIRKVSDLRDRNPMLLYKKLNKITGKQHDKCMLYILRCAVYFVSENIHEKDKLNWWYWKDKKYNEI